ncbi:MAG: glycosyl transferase, partial [Selenomonas sp.]|nr:glycosyl transferase [Selenomonas sp.]
RLGEPGAVLFRRKDLTHHYWQAEVRGYKTISDMVMWLELLEKGDWYFYPQVLSYYRRHENQEGQTPDIILLSRIEMYNLLTEYFRRQVYIENRQEYTEALQGLVAEYDNLAEIRSAGTRKMQVEYDKIIGKCKVLLKKSK